MTPLPEDDVVFYLAAAQQLPEHLRPAFEMKVAATLGSLRDPGAGDANRAIRQALDEMQAAPPVVSGRGAPPRWRR